jgi:hypothetical protein
MVTDPRTDRSLKHVGILLMHVYVYVWRNEPSRIPRVLNDGERASRAPESFNTTPMRPSQTFTTGVCTSIFNVLSSQAEVS